MSGEFGEPWHYEGADAIVGFFRGVNDEFGTLRIENDVQRALVTPPCFVAFIRATVTSCGVSLGHPTKSWTGSIDMVMALHIVDGKVRRRTDWADYPGSQLALAEIERGIGDQPDDPRCAAYAPE